MTTKAVKTCPGCMESKEITEFYVIKKTGKPYAYCKPCSSRRNRDRFLANPEKYRTLSNKYYHARKAADPVGVQISTKHYSDKSKAERPAEWRAKRFLERRDARGIGKDITKAYIADLFRNAKRCACCGRVLVLAYKGQGTKRTRENLASPSIDRVDNTKRYTKANMAVICWSCNFRKTDLTLKDLRMFIDYITNQRTGNHVR
jgi:hypothetical protein